MKLAYAEVRADFEKLESVIELHDHVELDSARLNLMQNPTKAEAAQMYLSAIGLWFGERRSKYKRQPELPEWVFDMADKYGFGRAALAPGSGE
ncbi:hypothetical protein ACI0FM_08490 [Paenochrobactrum sp. BZR 588]|uniref:hypothetical protein n=1 Tax=Paenochrobactrum TaxID=999488 RepID=UPI0035BBFCA2